MGAEKLLTCKIYVFNSKISIINFLRAKVITLHLFHCIQPVSVFLLILELEKDNVGNLIGLVRSYGLK